MYKRWTLNFGKIPIETVGKYDIPLLQKQNISLPKTWIGFNQVKTFKGECTQMMCTHKTGHNI